jgi:hypothetical protein
MYKIVDIAPLQYAALDNHFFIGFFKFSYKQLVFNSLYFYGIILKMLQLLLSIYLVLFRKAIHALRFHKLAIALGW